MAAPTFRYYGFRGWAVGAFGGRIERVRPLERHHDKWDREQRQRALRRLARQRLVDKGLIAAEPKHYKWTHVPYHWAFDA